MTRIIDISKHNGAVDFEKVREDGISGVIIRAGYGRLPSQKDPMFESYYAGARSAGLNIGAYWYSYAASAEEAKIEAAVFAEAINGKRFELPLYLDIEEKKQVSLGKAVCSEIAEAFCKEMESSGYFTGIYSFDSFFGSNLTSRVQAKYSCWAARVENIKPVYCKAYDMHQYTWKGIVKGISGAVDISYCYKDFPDIIKRAGLNGYGGKSAVYSVTAEIGGCSYEKALAVKNACVKMGMTAAVKTE